MPRTAASLDICLRPCLVPVLGSSAGGPPPRLRHAGSRLWQAADDHAAAGPGWPLRSGP
jgi:hypothetical protein